MNENEKTTVCPGCENHCLSTALKCGKGRAILSGEANREFSEHGHGHGHHGHHGKPRWDNVDKESLPGKLIRCMDYMRHSLREDGTLSEDLFQVLSTEDQVALKALLEKLLDGWNGTV